MMLACIWASSVQRAHFEKHDAAVGIGLRDVAQAAVRHGEHLAEDIVFHVVFKQRIFALAVHAVKMRLARKKNAQAFHLRLENKYGIALFELAHLGTETAHHRVDARACYALEKLNILKLHC